jgi:hypothetical protein
MDRISAIADEMPSASLHAKHKSSLRQQTVANVSGAMRIRNISMLLNPSPCQIVDAAQHDGVIRERTNHSLRSRAFREEANKGGSCRRQRQETQ